MVTTAVTGLPAARRLRRLVQRRVIIDRLYRLAYRGAYRMMRLYWKLARPHTHGALVLIWHRGEVLLVRNSYVRYHSAPGGYVRGHESGRQAAVRELLEETGIRIAPEALRPALDEHHEWEGKHEHIEIFELEVDARPRIRVDNREVIEARSFTPDSALALALFRPLRDVIARRATRPR